MNKQRAIKTYESILVVRVGVVPFDMMRYDHCFPATEDESRKLERVANGDVSDPADHVVRFLRRALNPGPPTTARWQSFGCEVLGVEDASR